MSSSSPAIAAIHHHELNPRHGFHFQCETCGISRRVGGIEDPKHFSNILQAELKAHRATKCTSHKDPKVYQSYHAAELAHVASTPVTSHPTTTNATYATVTGASISAASFTTGKKYLISVVAQLDSSNASTRARCQVTHGTTAFPDSEFGEESEQTTPSRLTYGWWYVWTAVSGEAINFQFATGTAATAIGADNISLIAIKLSDDLVEDTGSGGDWKSDIQSTATSLTATDSSTGNAVVTVTPAVASQQWLVLSKARIDTSNATNEAGSRIVRSGETNATGPFTQHEGDAAANEFFIQTLHRVYTLGAVSNTFTQKSFASGNAHSRTHSGIFILNLSKLRNTVDSYDDSSVQDLVDSPNYGTQVRTVSITPSVTGDVWVYASMTYDCNVLAGSFRARLQIDDVDAFGANSFTTDAYIIGESWDVLDEYSYNMQSMTSMTSGTAHHADLDASAETAAAGRGARVKSLSAITMELTPNILTKIVNESVGVGEQPMAFRGRNVSVSETVGIGEEVGRIFGKVLVKTVPGQGDYQTPDDFSEADYSGDRDVPNFEGITINEEVTTVLGRQLVEVVNEMVGIAEEVQLAANKVRIVSESLPINEEATRQFVRSLTDEETIGIGEEVGFVLTSQANHIVRIIPDPIGDYATPDDYSPDDYYGDEAVANYEKIGIGEEVTVVLSRNLVRIVNELVGVNEEEKVAADKVRVVSESLPINEQTSRIAGKNIGNQETVGVGEEVGFILTSTIRDLVKMVPEPGDYATPDDYSSADYSGDVDASNYEKIGIGEEVTTVRGKVQIVEESDGGFTPEGFTPEGFTVAGEYPGERLDIHEEVVAILGRSLVKIVNESVGIAEDITRIRNRIMKVDESLGIGEATVIARSLVRIVEEQMIVNEQIQKMRGRIQVINEAVSIGEELLRSKSIVQVVDETLGLAEALNEGLAKTRIIDETMTVDEVVSHILGRTKAVDEIINISEVVKAIITPQANAIVQIVNENVSINEDVAILKGIVQIVEENEEVAEEVVKVANLTRVVNESVIIEEATVRLRSLARLIDETVSIQEIATPVKAITQIVDEVVGLSEQSTSTIGKVQIIDEGLQILESIVERLVAYVPPPTVPVEQRVGGALIHKPRPFRIRKGARIVHLGPRYYLPQQTVKSRTETEKQIERRRLKQQQIPRRRIFAECKAVYSREAPAPSVADILNKLELSAIINRAREAQQQTTQLYNTQQSQREVDYDQTHYEQREEPNQFISNNIVAPIPIKTVVKTGVVSKYQKLAIFNTECISNYEKRVLVATESPIIAYEKRNLVLAGTATASYSKKKPIAKNHEQQIKTLEGLAVVMAMLDATERV